MKVCRICLSKEGRLYPITSHGLRSLYEQLTGVLKLEVDVDRRLPQWVCAECGLRLLSYNKLKQKSLRSHQILTNLLDRVSYITEDDIDRIDREINDLNSNLSYSIIDHGIIHEYGSDTQVSDNEVPDTQLPDVTKWNTTLKIEEVAVDAFKTEKEDELLSETAVSNTDINSDNDSDFLSELQDKKARSSPTESKLPKTRSQKPLKAKKKKARLELKKEVDKYMTSLNKKIAKIKKSKTKKVGAQKKTDAIKTKKTVEKVSDPEDVITVQKLTLEEQIAEFENKKNSSNYTNAIFKCDDCFKGFNTEVTFARHKLMHTDKWGKIECKVCKRRFRTERAHWSHMLSHKNIYRCKECPFISNLRAAAAMHRLKHQGKVYTCPHCNIEFEHHSSYLSHVRIKHVSEFVCELCGFSFVSANGVEIHKNLKHALEQNNETVSVDGPTCVKCKIKFVSDKAYNTHIRISHPKNPDMKKRNDCYNTPGKILTNIICELCGIKSADSRTYIFHFRHMHPGNEPTQTNTAHKKKRHMCDQCGRVFDKIYNLISHSAVHTGQMPYECHDCNKRFKKKLYVQNHIVNVHLPKKHKVYPCGLCGREFNNPSNRHRHMKVHSGLRPFHCEVCGSSFKSKAELKAHTTHVHLNKPWPKRKERGSRQGNNYM